MKTKYLSCGCIIGFDNYFKPYIIEECNSNSCEAEKILYNYEDLLEDENDVQQTNF
jgi:hypothetical protein